MIAIVLFALFYIVPMIIVILGGIYETVHKEGELTFLQLIVVLFVSAIPFLNLYSAGELIKDLDLIDKIDFTIWKRKD